MNTQRPHAFATQIFLAALAVLATGGCLGFTIVDLRHELSISANHTRKLEQRIAESERLFAEVGALIAIDLSPDVLARRNQSLALGLVPPAESQVVRVAESVERRLTAKRNVEIFAAENGQVVLPLRFKLGGAPR
jgi:hypothetical protein